MDISDGLSAIAVLTSFYTFWWTTRRPGRPIASAPRVIAIIRGPDRGYFMATTLFITNTGARPAQVDYLHARIRHQGSEILFNCQAEMPFREVLHKEEVPVTQENYPQSFSLPQDTSITKHLLFVAKDYAQIPVGAFTVEFLANLAGSSKVLVVAKRKMNFTREIEPGEWIEVVALRTSDVAEI